MFSKFTNALNNIIKQPQKAEKALNLRLNLSHALKQGDFTTRHEQEKCTDMHPHVNPVLQFCKLIRVQPEQSDGFLLPTESKVSRRNVSRGAKGGDNPGDDSNLHTSRTDLTEDVQHLLTARELDGPL